MTLTQNWTAWQGLNFDKVVPIKDRRTRRVLRPTDAAGALQTDAYGGLLPFTVTLNSDGSLWLHLAGADLLDLAPGDYAYDVVATIPMQYPANDYQTRKVMSGTITVKAYTTITYGDEDTSTMELRFRKGEDFTRPILWNDSAGVLQTVQKAYLEATDSLGATVLDLRWFTAVPNSAAIAALPANQRGYIISGALPGETACTLTLRIDHTNSLPAGTFPFNLFVQDSLGDWDCLIKGTIYVGPAVGTAPY